jgi:cysteinyl-tRNA synthetase
LFFSDESIEFAEISLNKLYEKAFELFNSEKTELSKKYEKYKNQFKEYINDDLNVPSALAMTWDVLKDKELSDYEKHELLIEFDKVFGLKISSIKTDENISNSNYIIKTFKDDVPFWTSDINSLPEEVKILINQREEYRKNKDWRKSDEIRDKLESIGWQIEDSGEKTIIKSTSYKN